MKQKIILLNIGDLITKYRSENKTVDNRFPFTAEDLKNTQQEKNLLIFYH